MTYDSTSRVGVHGVGLIVERELKWSFREQSVSDWGVDAFIEIINQVPSGKLLALQIKGGSSYFREETTEGFVYRRTRRHLAYGVLMLYRSY
jgi:hypothetical protein